jgi:predicted O-methyltransferase YrrM
VIRDGVGSTCSSGRLPHVGEARTIRRSSLPAETTRTRYYSFAELLDRSRVPGEQGIGAEQQIMMYEEARVRDEPVILELGVDRGASTTVFLQACAEKNGQLVSVDIRDCSEVAQDDRWRFVQSDSTDVATILSEAPELRDGIDVLYVDSLHDWRHVEKELYGWFPYLKQGSVIFFDDVDPSSARKGQRSDSFTLERQYGQIHRFVEAFFLSNLDSTRLGIAYGSTGLAKLRKFSPMGSNPHPLDWSRMEQRWDLVDLRLATVQAGKWLRDKIRGAAGRAT